MCILYFDRYFVFKVPEFLPHTFLAKDPPKEGTAFASVAIATTRAVHPLLPDLFLKYP
jgi:hypothetical protein